MGAGQHASRLLLAATGILPAGQQQQQNDTVPGTGRVCDGFTFDPNNPNSTVYSTWYSINCISTFTVDSQIFITMWTTAAVGALCVAVFCWGQSFVSVYRGRLLSPSVAIKPPVFSDRGFFAKYFAWLWVTIAMSENELLATAGMDALMFERLIIFCLQFMFPVMVIAVSTLIPIHLNSKYLADNTSSGQQFAKSNLMALTMGNLEPEAKTLWVHFVFVILFTAYGMWLLDQHYKSYVLLRQRYLTHGDSVSAWMGPNKIQARTLASYNSILLDQPTQYELYNPLWTFARAKASDSDTGTRNPPSTATSISAGAGAAAAAGSDSTAVAGGQQGGGLSKLVSMQHGGGASASSCFAQQQPLQGAEDSVYVSSAAATAAEKAAPNPFASPSGEHELLQARETLQMVSLADIIIPVPSEAPSLQGEQHSTVGSLPRQGSAAATMQAPADRSFTASPSESSSAPGSRLTSRQSSGRALLAGKHLDSSAAAAPAAEADKRGSKPFGFLHRGSKGHKTHADADPQPAAASDKQLESAEGAVAQAAGGRARRRFSGCAPGGCNWRRLDCRSTEDDAPVVSFAAEEGQLVQEQERKQRRAAARMAEKTAAKLAAKQLGVDVDWWQYKTGDLLLDRHIVRSDVQQELDSSEQDPSKLYHWWEMAPGDTFSISGEVALSGSGSGSTSGAGASSSNLVSVPNTSLLLDKRSLRTRRPSVRFRNTVHVKGKDGCLVPLHVSNYAVLVTDVPDLPCLQRSLSDRSTSSWGVEFAPGRSLCGPFAQACSSLLDALDHALQFVCWGWPCLLSRAELRDYSKGWIQLSFKTAQLSFASRPASIDRDALCMDQLEAGMLLSTPEKGQDSLQEAPEQQQEMQPQHRRSMSARTLLREPTSRQALVEATFKQLFPDDVQAVIPAQEYKVVNELLREWNRKLQVYIHTVALCELKRQKRKQERTAAAAAAGASSDAAVSAQQVCIEVTSMRGRAAGKAAAGAASPAVAGASGAPVLGVNGAPSAAQPNANSSSTGAVDASALGPQPPQQPAMARPGRHSRNSSGCDSDLELSDSDEEMDCCTAAIRKMCCCACCGVGAIQDGGHGLRSPDGDVGMDSISGAQERKRRCWGLFGGRKQEQEPKKGSKDVLKEKQEELLELEAKILEEQKKVLAGPDTGNFIVLFKTPQAANLAAHSTVYPDTGEGEPFKVQPAPSPEDVLWPSLWASPSDRRSVLGIVSFWYAILYLIPTGFFAASLNAISLTACSHGGGSEGLNRTFAWFCNSPFLKFLVTIVAPYILLIVWQNAVIPAQMYRLELRRAAAVSLSQMERRLLLVYCGWELTNIFLGGVLSGSLVSQVQVFFKHPEQWAQVLGAAIPQTSNFFLNYVITRAFMLNLVRLLMPHGGMWRWIGQMLFTGFTGFRHAATASYRACIIYPASIRYGREPGLVLLILLIGMAYCVAAPLITVFVFAYMVTAYIVWRYQIIYVCVRAYESGGKMWPTYFLCVEYCLAFFVAFTSAMLIFKKANMQGVLVLLLLPMLYIFNRRCRQKYRAKVDHPPLWLAHAAPRSEIDPLVYLPTCLQPNAQGWFFEAGKPWIRWGVPSYNNPKKPGHDAGGCCC